MEAVTKLKNIGVDKDILIIGGGTSVDINNIPKKIIKMGVNLTPGIKVDYLVYRDKLIKEALQHSRVVNGLFQVKNIISSEEETAPFVKYYYNENMVKYGDHTGYIALQIADKIFNFTNIYLMGFDYYSVEDRNEAEGFSLHYYGESVHRNWNRWNSFVLTHKKHFNDHVEDFDKQEWSNNIINLNFKSRLKRFSFGKIKNKI